MSLKNWLTAVASAFVAYFILYQLVSKPLTDGEIARLVQQKAALLSSTTPPRLILLAGSNGRFSHSCKAIEAEIGIRCANASLAAGIGIDYVFQTFSPLLRPGDVIYMPLEYEQYDLPKEAVMGGPENAILWRDNLASLFSLGIERTIRAAFFADSRYFLQGAVEMVLSRKGIKRRFDESSINDQGDQQGHTKKLGEPYRQFLNETAVKIPTITPDSAPKYSSLVIKKFLAEAHAHGIKVIGGLPSTISNARIPPSTIQEIRNFYMREGQSFAALPNYSQYPRNCFFDKPYHLHEECQTQHSTLVARMLAPLLKQ